MSSNDPRERRTFLAQVTGATLAMTAAPSASPGAEPAAPARPPELPPADLDALEQSVQAVIDRKRIGRPVFVRYTQLGAVEKGELVARLSRMLDAARRWLGQPLATVYALGSREGGQVTLAVQTPEGATALVSLGRARAIGDGIDLMVIGDHGSIYHDGGQGLLGCGEARYRQVSGEPVLVRLIERALSSGRPERLLPEEKP
jgi:hypothetical protein